MKKEQKEKQVMYVGAWREQGGFTWEMIDGEIMSAPPHDVHFILVVDILSLSRSLISGT